MQTDDLALKTISRRHQRHGRFNRNSKKSTNPKKNTEKSHIWCKQLYLRRKLNDTNDMADRRTIDSPLRRPWPKPTSTQNRPCIVISYSFLRHQYESIASGAEPTFPFPEEERPTAILWLVSAVSEEQQKARDRFFVPPIESQYNTLCHFLSKIAQSIHTKTNNKTTITSPSIPLINTVVSWAFNRLSSKGFYFFLLQFWLFPGISSLLIKNENENKSKQFTYPTETALNKNLNQRQMQQWLFLQQYQHWIIAPRLATTRLLLRQPRRHWRKNYGD